MSDTLRPYRVEIPQADLDDLRSRLERTRWPHEAPGHGWEMGANREYLKGVIEHWRTAYDWRAFEAKLNSFEQYEVLLDDLRIHTLVERGSGPSPMPLILTHGWPGSVAEFVDLIQPLAHPERFGGDVGDAFTVIVPSLPGYGFSSDPSSVMTPGHVAGLWKRLMKVFGFDRFAVHGGDWGGIVSSWLALEHPASLIALHLNMLIFVPRWTFKGQPPDEAEIAFITRQKANLRGEDAYQQIQGTKPQTLAFGLTDSPAGLAAWILEKFHRWTDPARPVPIDTLLSNLMLYWLGGISSSTWMYRYLVDGSALELPHGRRVEVPTGFLLFPHDLAVIPPDRWLARSHAKFSRRDVSFGGHFPGMEAPDVLLEHLREYFRDFR